MHEWYQKQVGSTAISALKVINLGRDRHKCIIEFVVFIGSLLGSCKAIVFDLQKGED